MKRSEFLEIVNGVMSEEDKRIAEEVKQLFSGEKKVDINDMASFLIGEITAVSARTTGAIIERCGLLHFEDDSV